ncbi:MAG: GspMb/PilO family protein [bacterium]|nr:GspMb/PilO family protein [bacterium]
MISIFKRCSSFTAVILLGILVAVTLIGVVGQRVYMSRAARELSLTRKESAGLVRDLRALRLHSREYAELSAGLGIAEAGASAETGGVSAMIDRVTGIVESQGCAVTSLRPEQATVKEGVSRQPIRIGLECSLDELIRILYKTERDKHLLVVEKMDVRQPEGDKNGIPGRLRVEMTVASFTLEQSDNASMKKGSDKR